MKSIPFSLDVIDIQSPCPASWDAMRGSDRVRFCGECKMHVYDLSAMTREAARQLVNEHEGRRLCVRFYRRADGTVLTQDGCGRVRAAARRMRVFACAAVSVVLSAMLAPFGIAAGTRDRGGREIMGDVACPAPPTTQDVRVMGEVEVPTMGEPVPTTQPATHPTTRAAATQPARPVTMGLIATPPLMGKVRATPVGDH